MNIKKRICGTTAFLSFIWLIGVAENSDLGLEPDFSKMVLKCLAGLIVFIISMKVGGFDE